MAKGGGTLGENADLSRTFSLITEDKRQTAEEDKDSRIQELKDSRTQGGDAVNSKPPETGIQVGWRRMTVSIILPSASDFCAWTVTAKSNNSSDNIRFMAKEVSTELNAGNLSEKVRRFAL